MSSSIGIANLPNQKHRKAIQKGGHFTLMLVGSSGLGKTTFVNTLFLTSLCSHKDLSSRFQKTTSGVEIKLTEATLEENGFKLRLTLIDTPGFGDSVNNTNSWVPIVEYIEKQHTDYFNNEMKPDRRDLADTRVHACLYFLEPTGHSLKPLDVEAMKELGTRVNLIPVIAKADTLTPTAILDFKKRICDDIKSHGIQLYRCTVESEDEETTKHNTELMDAIPFAVIGSEEVYEVNGQKVHGRKYPWGIAEVENEAHCDFKKLRSLLIRTHLLDLIFKTESEIFENFRDSKLEKGGLVDGMTPEQFRKEHELKMKKQEEAIRKKFTEQVKQEEARFRSEEEKLYGEGERLTKELEGLKQEVEAMKEEVNRLAAARAIPKKK